MNTPIFAQLVKISDLYNPETLLKKVFGDERTRKIISIFSKTLPEAECERFARALSFFISWGFGENIDLHELREKNDDYGIISLSERYYLLDRERFSEIGQVFQRHLEDCDPLEAIRTAGYAPRERYSTQEHVDEYIRNLTIIDNILEELIYNKKITFSIKLRLFLNFNLI
jgi:hypothetical protein